MEPTMTLMYDMNRNRIICKWKEATKVVMNKEAGLMGRIRSISLKTTPRGKIAKADWERYHRHPKFNEVIRFNKHLLKLGFYPVDKESYQCAVCGAKHMVRPYLSKDSQSVVFYCPDHQVV